ncbi:ferredoxin [Lysobacter bugurensis]|uniref:Ferredoxin n=1 Tax=Cognatilysobacter bugurensis TaxID=543356 RepID=A0A918T319_9GAMM|nr:ferredoxin [Lysobacter bugurensis]
MRGSLNGDDGHNERGNAQREWLIEFDRIADGGFAEVEASIDDEPESLVLFREGDAVRAWLNVCPHAGRRLDWSPGQFLKSKDGLLVCAAHGAGFELLRGECVSGPCRGQTLRAVEVDVHDGRVFLRANAAQ